ncbi:MAG: twin-arginine translocase subunit TatC [Archaeoglobaceae archaeon]|nr:twin-arginine translocase subunit TatC [Archaeoglobaceae archaeon]
MEAKDWAGVILEFRKNLIRIFILLVLTIATSFPFTPAIIQFIIDEMYPKPEITTEKIQIVSDELQKAAERLKSANNMTSALEELKKVLKLVSPYAGPIVLTPVEFLILSVKLSIAFGICSVIPYMIFLVGKALRLRGILKTSTGYYVITSFTLFVLGILYGLFIMRFVIQFLHNITVSHGIIPLYSLAEFVNFVLFMILIFGIFFQIPLVMVFIVKNGIVHYSTIKYYRRHTYVLFFILSAIATPTVDIFTQTMLAVPMIFLFEIGLLFSKLLGSSSNTKNLLP